jgi:sugar/nucleoside kinase (ribokinase family)
VSTLRALLVGALSRDLAPGEDGPGRAGGVVVHAGCALARLGATTHVVTRVHPEDVAELTAPLHAAGIVVRALPSRATTTYVNDYTGPVDRHELRATSDPIGPDDVPPTWRAADVVQLGPLHPGDIRPETVAVLRGLRGLDVQGLVRQPGTAVLRACDALPVFLPHVDVVQANEAEIEPLLAGDTVARFMARHAVRELLVTRGARGVTVLLADGAAHDVPAVPAGGGAKVGAGDVFLAAYLLERATGGHPVTAAAVAARAVALEIAADARPATRSRT